MVAILSIGTARSRWTSDGKPALGPDEDLFTLASAAAEMAMAGPLPALRSVSLEVAGPIPPVADWAIPALLGTTGATARSTSVGEAIQRHATIPSGEGILILEASSGSDGAAGEPPGALALLLGDDGGWNVTPSSRSTAELLRSSIRQLEGLRDGRAGGSRDIGGGSSPRYTVTKTQEIPFGAIPAKGTAAPALSVDRLKLERAHDPTLVRRVSEGAYIPRVRYIESIPSRWRFVAERCSSCGAVTFPLRQRCRGCGREEGLSPVSLPPEGGRVLALTSIGPGGQPTEFDPLVEAVGGYQVAIVELAPGCRATLQVTDASAGELSIGDRVSTRLRRLYPMEGEWRYGRKAIPLADPAVTHRPDR